MISKILRFFSICIAWVFFELLYLILFLVRVVVLFGSLTDTKKGSSPEFVGQLY